MTVSFDVSSADAFTIDKIVDRAEGIAADFAIGDFDRLSLTMDLTACHANGNPLRLDDLLAARPFDFAHDVFGISRFIDRDTGKLTDHFSPRYSERLAA